MYKTHLDKFLYNRYNEKEVFFKYSNQRSIVMKRNQWLKNLLLILLCCLTVVQTACTPPLDTTSTTSPEENPPADSPEEKPSKEKPVVLKTGGMLNDARYTDSEFYLTTKDGTECRLTLDGKNGWRLQALDPDVLRSGYIAFEDVGAAQSLAKYMGEDYNTAHSPLTVTHSENAVTVRGKDIDTYVTIQIGASFNISFHGKNDDVLMNVSYISAYGKIVTMRGKLTPDEAVVGGGQRFDAVNRRNTSMKLYTYDAYNADGGKGTYVAIPLFATSRGGGMFINRYETMTAEFDKTNVNEWSIKLENDLMDAYFYADGAISDVLHAYTDLTGHATLPEEWGQGVLVCRYSPDFQKLDVDQKVYSALEEIPGYESLYADNKKTTLAKDATLNDKQYLYNSSGRTQYYYLDGQFIRVSPKGNPNGSGVREVVEGLIGAGMKPTAVMLEAFPWTSIGNNSENEQELKNIIAWLDSLGIKTMLYMAVAGIGTSFDGYKSEYYLTATVNGEVTSAIPKVDKSENPDAAGSRTQRYLDITNPEAVEWYLDSMWAKLLEFGIDGIKIDFCETMPNEGTYPNGMTLKYNWYNSTLFASEGDTIHHAYSTYFISLFYRSMLEQKAAKNIDDGFVVLSRGGGIGSQRSPYMWAGDQTRIFHNLSTQLIAMLTSGASGIPFMTYDMAGYAYSSTGGYFKEGALELESEVFTRSIQYTAFTSVIQTHGDVRHLYQLTEEAQRISASYTTIHNELMPYIRKISHLACDTGMPMTRAMILYVPNDKNVYDIDDEYMFGDALLVAPILTEATTSREVYLPEGTWIDLLSGEKYEVGASGKTLTVNATMEQIPVFLNANSADAQSLLSVFNGETWQDINGGHAITLG